jgi:hypothetical protein
MKNDKYESVLEIFKNKKIRAIGIIGDVDQAKSNVIYHCIKNLHEKYQDKIYSYGLHLDIDGTTKINSIADMEAISDSIIFIDEFPNLFSLNNRRQLDRFENTMRQVFHHTSNNTVVICGLPHNFNKFLSGLIQIIILKQCTLEDFIQRSSPQQAIASFSPAGLHYTTKGSELLKMPKNVAIVYNRTATTKWSEVQVPYEKEFDSKDLFCKEIRVPKENIHEPSRMESILRNIPTP